MQAVIGRLNMGLDNIATVSFSGRAAKAIAINSYARYFPHSVWRLTAFVKRRIQKFGPGPDFWIAPTGGILGLAAPTLACSPSAKRQSFH